MLIVLGRTRHTRVAVFPASLPSLESFAEKFGSSLVSVLEHSCSHRRLHHAEINFSSSIALAGGREQFEAAVCLKASGLPTSAVRSPGTRARPPVPGPSLRTRPQRRFRPVPATRRRAGALLPNFSFGVNSGSQYS